MSRLRWWTQTVDAGSRKGEGAGRKKLKARVRRFPYDVANRHGQFLVELLLLFVIEILYATFLGMPFGHDMART